jgi:hypothetical protein
MALDDQVRQQHGLLGVVGDGARGQPGGQRMVRRPRLEGIQQVAVAGHDVRPGARFRRHPERITDRQPVQRSERM